MATEKVTVEVEGRTLALSNLDKVLYPRTGFTKGEVIDYYRRIAPVMLPHLADRCVTLRRFPDGVEGSSFFEKRCPTHRPDWFRAELGPGDRKGGIEYCVFDEVASLVWSANMAAIELHAPMARHVDLDSPDMVVFDLDPGAPASMTECAVVALSLQELFEGVGLRAFPKTSGSKGLQVYVPVNGGTPDLSHGAAADFALGVAQLLARDAPDLVITSMNKAERTGKVFVDWSQNSRHKTTVAVYSLRARPMPTVSTPVSWEEVAAAADGAELSWSAEEMPGRIEDIGDLFAETLTVTQQIPVG